MPKVTKRGLTVAGILFLFALLLGRAGVLFYNAHDLVSIGTPWASDACSVSKMFCSHPHYLFYGAAGAMVLAIGLKIGSTLTGD